MLPDDEPRAFDGAASYRIVVDGLVAESLSDRLGGMTISQVIENDNASSILLGELADQSELAGVLNFLYDLQKTILYVEKLPAGGD